MRERCVRNFGGGVELPLDLTPVTGSTLARQEGQRPVAGGFELPVGHGEFDLLWLVSKLSRRSSIVKIEQVVRRSKL
jgi:hypothetical protein